MLDAAARLAKDCERCPQRAVPYPRATASLAVFSFLSNCSTLALNQAASEIVDISAGPAPSAVVEVPWIGMTCTGDVTEFVAGWGPQIRLRLWVR